MDFITQYQFFILLALVLLEAGFAVWQFNEIKKKLRPLFAADGSKGEKNFQTDIIRRLMKLEAKAEELQPHLDRLEEISKVSVRKVGFLRFNPFQDTGGDNSFVAAFLDGENNGIIISSLYTREGVRLYAKKIENGSSRHHLSEEEKKVLEETLQK